MIKNYSPTEMPTESVLTAEDLECIHAFTRKEVTADEIYTFPVILCDNEIDRDGERFTADSLRTLCAMFVGKTGIFDHSMESRDQTARIYKAECIEDPGRQTTLGEKYTFIRAHAYMPKTPDNASLISEIECGIKKEVSVGCAVAEVRCSVCGSDVRTSPCTHRKGEIYDGAVCHHILETPTDAYEWSFVAVPAQRNAGITKAFTQSSVAHTEDVLKAVTESTGSLTLSEGQISMLQKQLSILREEAELGKTYKSSLVRDTVRLGLAALPDTDGETLRIVCEKLSVKELSELSKGFSALAQKHMPLQLQLFTPDGESDKNHCFII